MKAFSLILSIGYMCLSVGMGLYVMDFFLSAGEEKTKLFHLTIHDLNLVTCMVLLTFSLIGCMWFLNEFIHSKRQRK